MRSQTEALAAAGLSPAHVEDSISLLSALPSVHLFGATIEVEGEDEILERDMVKVKVRVVLSRASHHQKEGTRVVESNEPIPGRWVTAVSSSLSLEIITGSMLL